MNACTVKVTTTIVSHAHPVIRGILAQCRIGFRLPTITRTSPPTLHSPIYIQSMFFHVHKLYLRARESREEGRERDRGREKEGKGEAEGERGGGREGDTKSLAKQSQ